MIPLGVWWFGHLSTMSQPPSPALGTFSTGVLQALVIAQMLSVCLFAAHWHPSSIAAHLLPAWPLLAMLGLAAGIPIVGLLASQLAVAAGGSAVFGIAALLRRFRMPAETMRLARTSLGVLCACLAWMSHGAWLPGTTP
jgi:hypothetical protein